MKFTPNKGKIEIKSNLENDTYLFEIKDTGVGLEEHKLETIFDKFEIIPDDLDGNYNKNKGTGLGLYISKGIIEAHGGSIIAKSEGPNKGTIVRFIIPIKKEIQV
ncbi:MAG: sensor histidine kinase [Promethearchaeota archaeon]